MHPAFVDIYKFKTWKQCGTPILVCPCKKPPEVFFQSHQVTCVSSGADLLWGPCATLFFTFLGDEECQNGPVGATADEGRFFWISSVRLLLLVKLHDLVLAWSLCC